MKIAVTAQGKTLHDRVDPRFGRCPYFLVVDAETLNADPVENPNVAQGGGAGIQSAQLMAEHDVKVVLTGNCGPNAYQTLNAADIEVIVGVSGTVREAVEQFKSGALSSTQGPSVASHFGMGTGAAGSSAQIGQTPTDRVRRRLLAVVDAEKCTTCGLCETICPAGAITIEKIAAIDAEKCTGCGQCVAECPQDALTLKKG